MSCWLDSELGILGALHWSNGEHMRIRVAKPCDASAIAQLYLEASRHIEAGFVAQLGFKVLRLNYELLLSEPGAIVLCLDDGDGEVAGFVSGSLQFEEHFKNLARRKLSLSLACMGAFLCHPSLILGAVQRYAAVRGENPVKRFVVSSGPRIEFWACSKKRAVGVEAIELLKAWLGLAKSCGCSDVQCEVDEENQHVLRIHQALGATVVEQLKMGDGRTRYILKYAL